MKRNAPKKEVKANHVPDFQDIHIRNIVCRGCKTGIKASGIEGMNSVHDIDIQDCSIVYRQNDMIVDEATAHLSTQNVVFTKDKK